MSTSSSITDRTLHLVDLENLVGDPRPDPSTALSTLAGYLDSARWQPHDHVVLATNGWLMARIAFDVPVAASTHVGRGPDGADLALLACAPPELVVKRYSRLVVGSGDGIFADRAATARDGGVAVEVVARADGCSRRLRQFSCTYLEPCATGVSVALAA